MTDIPFLEQLAEEEALFKKFSLVGHDNVRAAGNLKTGFAVNIDVVGGGDSGGTGTPTGGCCYSDGTCDDITCADCEDAGGICQGLGTTCAGVVCTGACCEPNCVEDTTYDGCVADGGTFQGLATTCDPDPCPAPTGACCAVGGDCSITTEVDCVGVYQGDDTVCDPNPCPSTPPCNGCGFAAYDGSGTYYLRETFTATYTDEKSCIDDFTCNEGVDCEVHSSKTITLVGEDCITTDSGESCDVHDGTDCMDMSTVDCGRCQLFVHFYDALVAVTSPTTKGYDNDGTVNEGEPCDPPFPERHVHLHYTLSEPCTP